MTSPPDGVGSDPVRATTVVYPPKGDQDTAELTLLAFPDRAPWLVERFCSRYTNPDTARAGACARASATRRSSRS